MVHHLTKPWCWSLALACLTWTSLSCNRGSDRAQVEGEVRYEGEPVDQGSIVFLPQEGGIKTGGQIIDGRYQVSAERGPPPGKHKVLLFWEKKTGDTFVDPDTGDVYDERAEGLPSQYQSEQTPLEVEITRGRNVHDFHLTGRGSP